MDTEACAKRGRHAKIKTEIGASLYVPRNGRPRSPDHHSHDQGSSPHPVPHLMAAALEGAESAVQKKDLVLGGHYHAGEGRTWFMGELRERAVGRIN